MGTNFYVKDQACKHCERYKEIHLGKSSYGWRFIFQLNGSEYYRDIDEMKAWLKGKQIWNEYGEKVAKKNFWEMVENKQDKMGHTNLGHGNMTIGKYDFCDNEFS